MGVCDDWCEESFSQERWERTFCGNSKVYLLFRFSSLDDVVSYGTFVDDVLLEAYYDGVVTQQKIHLPLVIR